MRPATDVLEQFLCRHRATERVTAGDVTIVGLAERGGAIDRIEADLDYLTLDEGLEQGLVEVEEISQSGSVPECRVVNRAERHLLLIEGDELRGAKQNRIVNASVLLEPTSTSTVPVSCIERGRWGYRSEKFSGGGRAHGSVLYHVKRSVTNSLRETRTYRSDQGAVWKEAAETLASTKTVSGTESLSDAYEATRAEVDDLVAGLGELEGATGMAVFVGRRLQSIELFDRPATLERIRLRLLASVAFESLYRRGKAEDGAAEPDIEAWLDRLATEPGSVHPSVGLGEHVRIDNEGVAASALVARGRVVHFGLQRGQER